MLSISPTIPRSSAMKRLQSPAQPSSERERDLQRASDFNALLLGMAGHDLRQPLQVIQSTYEWLSGKLDADAEKAWLRRGELAATMLTEQLDRLVDGVRLYDHTTKMKVAPVPLAPLLDCVRNENVELARQERARPAHPSDSRGGREQRHPARRDRAKSCAQCDQIHADFRPRPVGLPPPWSRHPHRYL